MCEGEGAFTRDKNSPPTPQGLDPCLSSDGQLIRQLQLRERSGILESVQTRSRGWSGFEPTHALALLATWRLLDLRLAIASAGGVSRFYEHCT